MKNKEQLEARQILTKLEPLRKLKLSFWKGLALGVTHTQMNESLMCKFCNQRRLSITWANQLLCLCHLWKYKTKKLVTGLAAMICISTVKIRARPWGGIYKQMNWTGYFKSLEAQFWTKLTKLTESLICARMSDSLRQTLLNLPSRII